MRVGDTFLAGVNICEPQAIKKLLAFIFLDALGLSSNKLVNLVAKTLVSRCRKERRASPLTLY